MNTSNLTTNTTTVPTGYYLSEDEWLTAFGSTWALDTFNFYPYIVAAWLGLALNSFSLAVFQDAEFNIALYKYLRVYCLNNMLICLIGTGNLFFSVRRMLPWTNSYYPNAYTNYFYIPMLSILNFFGSMIDIYILLDRIGNFNRRVKSWTSKWPVYRVCAITLIACSIFCIPFFLAYCSCSLTVKLNPSTQFTIWFGGVSELSQTLTMTVLLFFLLAVKEFAVLLVQIALNVVSIVLLKRFLMKKNRLLLSSSFALADVNANQAITASPPSFKISSTDQRATVSYYSLSFSFGLRCLYLFV
jgi:hypothetical protein